MSKRFWLGLISTIALNMTAAIDLTFAYNNESSLMKKTSESRLSQLKVTVGAKDFIIEMEQNPSVDALVEQLPLKVDMVDLNANEKYVDLPSALPVDAKAVGSLRVGDLMLYGNRTLVLFYKSFRTSYSYTRLGQIKDSEGLERDLGQGPISVIIDIVK